MKEAARGMEFEKAALLRDRIVELRRELVGDEEGLSIIAAMRSNVPKYAAAAGAARLMEGNIELGPGVATWGSRLVLFLIPRSAFRATADYPLDGLFGLCCNAASRFRLPSARSYAEDLPRSTWSLSLIAWILITVKPPILKDHLQK